MKELIMKHVVQNIAKYGKANEKSIMGKIMAEEPELRKKAKEIMPMIKESIEEFELLEPEEKKALFDKYKEVIEKKETTKKTLPPLKGAEKGKVVMRFAPNPNGPATLGSARGIIVNSEYAKMYGGKFILRFDDTDPRTKRPLLEAYDWYLDDCEWLGARPDSIIYASKRFSIYYEYIEKLLEMEKAYPCFCSQDEFKKFKMEGKDCPHRNTSKEESLEIWQGMLDGRYNEGEVVIRIRTNMQHKDPAIRDWVACRIVYEDHPLTGNKFHVYPMLDFESAIEDHINGITHIIRGKDLIDSERRQKYVYDYFGWTYPVTRHWGRVKIHEFGKVSTSTMRREIESSKYGGWDDPRLPTIRALRRRGFESEAVKNFFVSLGVGENDVSVSLKNLYAENRKIIDPVANRYFFIWRPVTLRIQGIEEREVFLPLLPDNVEKGSRRVMGGGNIMITSDDFSSFREGDVVRLKEYCNIRIENKENKTAIFLGSDILGAKKGRNIIHWLSEKDAVPCVVCGPDRDYSGYVERNVLNDIGRVVQFERFAFCRVEEGSNSRLVRAVYTHN